MSLLDRLAAQTIARWHGEDPTRPRPGESASKRKIPADPLLRGLADEIGLGYEEKEFLRGPVRVIEASRRKEPLGE